MRAKFQLFGVGLGVVAGVALIGCGSTQVKESAAEASASAQASVEASAQAAADEATQAAVEVSAQAAAQREWETCASCHGEAGLGDGPVTQQYGMVLSSFGDKDWQESQSDEDIIKIILEGGAAVGKSEYMPPYPHLVGQDEVVQELLSMVRASAD